MLPRSAEIQPLFLRFVTLSWPPAGPGWVGRWDGAPRARHTPRPGRQPADDWQPKRRPLPNDLAAGAGAPSGGVGAGAGPLGSPWTTPQGWQPTDSAGWQPQSAFLHLGQWGQAPWAPACRSPWTAPARARAWARQPSVASMPAQAGLQPGLNRSMLDDSFVHPGGPGWPAPGLVHVRRLQPASHPGPLLAAWHAPTAECQPSGANFELPSASQPLQSTPVDRVPTKSEL